MWIDWKIFMLISNCMVLNSFLSNREGLAGCLQGFSPTQKNVKVA